MEQNIEAISKIIITKIPDKTNNKNIFPELKRFGHTLTLSRFYYFMFN